MNSGKYLFSQLVEFLPKRVFDGIVKKYSGDKYVKTFTCWNQLLVMMYGQLSSCDSLREVICIIDAIKNKSYHLGFGSGDIKLSNVAYANANRDYRIFEEFVYYMINLAQSKRLDTIVLCLSLFQWAFMTLPDRTESTSSTPTSSSDRSILADNSTEHKIGMLTYSGALSDCYF